MSINDLKMGMSNLGKWIQKTFSLNSNNYD